ncbi:MAG: DUF4038 domain-containing protein [Caldilineaceae bacterium]
MTNRCELTLTSDKPYTDPFNQIEVEVEFLDPQGNRWLVPAFWTGGQEWRVRYLPLSPGQHHYRWLCSDTTNPILHGTSGVLEVTPNADTNELERHGRLRVAASKRHLEFADGTPFFWLGDTWWLGLVERKGWGLPEFRQLAADRVAKGFTVIQIVAGLYPDLPPYDPRGFNKAGYPWEPAYARINPAYFDAADRRMATLVDAGLLPCIVAAWGYHLPWLGLARMKQHWRYLVARWGSYPVVWCLAGEATMPYYLSSQREADAAFQKQGWTDIGRYVRALDPYHSPVTIHPCAGGRQDVEDESVLDMEMFGTGHGDWSSVPYHVKTITQAYARVPPLPLINAEVCYEGHMQANWQNVQRFMFWTGILSGATSYTYGAGGIWQMNTREQPHGPSPQGWTYENTPWDEAAQLPGARQLGLGKTLLTRYPWWRLQPMPDAVEPRWTPDNYFLPYAAGIPGQVRLVYIPARIYQASGPRVKALEQGVPYRAYYWNPIQGTAYDLGAITVDPDGSWQAPNTPLIQDWVLVLERQD